MSDLIVSAPLWRRFAAAVYDGLLLLGIWMATLLLSLPLRNLPGMQAGSPWLRALMFVVGLVFFGWFWTRGGQTLGMRAWRLQVRRELGEPLRWPVAAARYALMLLYWGLTLTPFAAAMIGRIPKLSALLPHAPLAAAIAASVVVLSIVLRGFDARRRLPHDWLSATEVVTLRNNPLPPTRPARAS